MPSNAHPASLFAKRARVDFVAEAVWLIFSMILGLDAYFECTIALGLMHDTHSTSH